MTAELVPVRLQRGPAWQLQSYVVMVPPFDPDAGDPTLSYAGAPRVPAVFSLAGGRYALTSLSFPEVYRKDREARRASCADEPTECAVSLWIDALALGDLEIERAR